MTKYRTRLLVGLITLIIIVLLGLGLVLGQLFKTYYLNTFNERLKKETEMLSVYIEENGGLSTLNRQEINSMADILNARITIADHNANVLVDTGAETDSATIERHREVIRDIVLKGKEVNDKEKFFSRAEHQYYWEPLSLNGDTEGYIFLTTKISELRNAYSQIWWILSVSLGLALAIIILLQLNWQRVTTGQELMKTI
jgi:two-component system phosphate regulon sensor histidine kinase PhoR